MLTLPPLPHAEDWLALRAAAVPVARDWLAERLGILAARFAEKHEAEPVLAAWSATIDRLLVWLMELAAAQATGTRSTPCSLIAIGGYGRGELFPYSDIDLLFLHGEADGERAAPLVEFVCYCLWDLGLKVGHAVRSPRETLAAADAQHTILTALLDARTVHGDPRRLSRLLKVIREQATPERKRAFADAKLAERTARHERHGNSRYVLEPQVKDGKGGLRDLHTLHWIARYVFGASRMKDLVGQGILTPLEWKRYRRAERFLSTVRVALHLAAGKDEERLTFDYQRQIAGELGFRESEANRSVERFMKRYFQVAGDAGALTRLVCTALEAGAVRSPKRSWALWRPKKTQPAGLVIDGGRIGFSGDDPLHENPRLMLELFRTAHDESLDYHPVALQEVSRHLGAVDRAFRADPLNNEIFADILFSRTSPETTLRQMRDIGLLGRFIPEFGRVVGQMQFDMFHIYTVDEHILRAVGILHRLEAGEMVSSVPVASELVGQVQSRRVLHLAALCHDIAKGRGGDHAIKGAAIARRLARRFAFTKAEKDALEWLVAHHQLFSDTAHKRDLSDRDTIRRFVGEVQTLDRLRLLLVLTVIDMHAVGPHIWNGWKASLLRELYARAEAWIRTGSAESASPEAMRQEIEASLPPGFQPLIARYLEEADPAFLGACPLAEHLLLIALLENVWQTGEPSVHLQSHPFHDISRIALIAPDRDGLLADATGAMARLGLTVAGARITTLKSGIAIQLWQVQDLGREVEEGSAPGRARALVLQEGLQCALAEPASATSEPFVSRVFARKTSAFDSPPEIYFENSYSGTFTILEISAPDRVGLLNTICRTLTAEGISVASAHIGTYGERAVDVFYVKDRFGMKIDHPARIQTAMQALKSALG